MQTSATGADRLIITAPCLVCGHRQHHAEQELGVVVLEQSNRLNLRGLPWAKPAYGRRIANNARNTEIAV